MPDLLYFGGLVETKPMVHTYTWPMSRVNDSVRHKILINSPSAKKAGMNPLGAAR
jgi:hypothetical protein